MQDGLFPDDAWPAAPAKARPPASGDGGIASVDAGARVEPAAPDPAEVALAASLPAHLRIGTSSWSYPGWTGIVWRRTHSEAALSRHGLAAYAVHPLLRTVGVDRGFYRALTASQFAQYAAAVPEDFRFVTKAPSAVTDALVRNHDGQGMQPNPLFLNPDLAARDFVQPALDGLGPRCGALVFQLSPLSQRWLADIDRLLARLDAMLAALPSLRTIAPDAVIAVEVRDRALLVPGLAAVLKRHGATYCLGLHAKLPPLAQQLPLLRALWPGPLVCRWNYHRRHGAYGYEAAEQRYAPFDRIVDADPATREALARVMAATAGAGQPVYVTISNKAEGSSPRSVVALARAVQAAIGPAQAEERGTGAGQPEPAESGEGGEDGEKGLD